MSWLPTTFPNTTLNIVPACMRPGTERDETKGERENHQSDRKMKPVGHTLSQTPVTWFSKSCLTISCRFMLTYSCNRTDASLALRCDARESHLLPRSSTASKKKHTLDVEDNIRCSSLLKSGTCRIMEAIADHRACFHRIRHSALPANPHGQSSIRFWLRSWLYTLIL